MMFASIAAFFMNHHVDSTFSMCLIRLFRLHFAVNDCFIIAFIVFCVYDGMTDLIG